MRAEDGFCPEGPFPFLFLLSFALGRGQSWAETLGWDMQWLAVSFCRAYKHPKSDSVVSTWRLPDSCHPVRACVCKYSYSSVSLKTFFFPSTATIT